MSYKDCVPVVKSVCETFVNKCVSICSSFACYCSCLNNTTKYNQYCEIENTGAAFVIAVIVVGFIVVIITIFGGVS